MKEAVGVVFMTVLMFVGVTGLVLLIPRLITEVGNLAH